MIALFWRRAIFGALRRAWAQRSALWLAFAAAMVIVRRLDRTSAQRARQRS
jgi:hypothetical protein